MKQSVGYTVTLNIIITFIVIVFFLVSAIIIYYKSNKVNNIIINSIEKYNSFSDSTKEEISSKLTSLGYNKKNLNCKSISGCTIVYNGSDGYCVYSCEECAQGEPYYYYKIKTNMMINVPILNKILELPIYSTTNRMYDFDKKTCS